MSRRFAAEWFRRARQTNRSRVMSEKPETEYYYGIGNHGPNMVVVYLASDESAWQIIENQDKDVAPVGSPLQPLKLSMPDGQILPDGAVPMRGSIPVFNPVTEAIEDAIRKAQAEA